MTVNTYGRLCYLLLHSVTMIQVGNLTQRRKKQRLKQEQYNWGKIAHQIPSAGNDMFDQNSGSKIAKLFLNTQKKYPKFALFK
jgi:hypothetical protein